LRFVSFFKPSQVWIISLKLSNRFRLRSRSKILGHEADSRSSLLCEDRDIERPSSKTIRRFGSSDCCLLILSKPTSSNSLPLILTAGVLVADRSSATYLNLRASNGSLLGSTGRFGRTKEAGVGFVLRPSRIVTHNGLRLRASHTFKILDSASFTGVLPTNLVIPFNTKPFTLSTSHRSNITDCAAIAGVRDALSQVKFLALWGRHVHSYRLVEGFISSHAE